MIILREAGMNDAESIWVWRNEPVARAMSGSIAEISWASHIEWYAAVLKDVSRRIFIGLDEKGGRIGMCRFDVEPGGEWAVVSLALDPAVRGRGLSSILLCESMKRFADAQDLNLRAYIRPGNLSSLRCFQRAGFVLSEGDGGGFLELVHRRESKLPFCSE